MRPVDIYLDEILSIVKDYRCESARTEVYILNDTKIITIQLVLEARYSNEIYSEVLEEQEYKLEDIRRNNFMLEINDFIYVQSLVNNELHFKGLMGCNSL